MIKEVCPNCHKETILYYVRKGDYISGQKVSIPRNICLVVCPKCGHRIREEVIK